MNSFVPFNRPSLAGSELDYIRQAIDSGHLSGDGSFSKKCHQLLERELAVLKVLLTTSGTHALEMAALLLNIQSGDEVIVPSYTFVSTINAFVMRGARPVFADIRSDTLNIDERDLEQHITPRTKAVLPVHYAGVGCEMDGLMAIAKQHRVAIVEDNAHGLFGRYRGRFLGTFGCFAVLSFHETKNFICGEGGALIINSPEYLERAEIIREKGTNRSKFFRGEIDKYGWVDLGSSYLSSDILAAFLFAQLEKRLEIQSKRENMWAKYHAALQEWANAQGVRLPFVPAYCEQSYHMFYLIMPTLDQRQALIAALKQKGIMAPFHYVPLHLSAMGRRYGGKFGDCPMTEWVSDRLLRLPLFVSMTDDEQQKVIDAVVEFVPKK